MKIAIGADHAGVDLKAFLVQTLQKEGHDERSPDELLFDLLSLILEEFTRRSVHDFTGFARQQEHGHDEHHSHTQVEIDPKADRHAQVEGDVGTHGIGKGGHDFFH